MYKLRYSPLAMHDMETVWENVFEASQSNVIANKYVKDFSDTIARKKHFPSSGIPLLYRGLFTGFYSVNFKMYKAFYRINGRFIEVIRIIMIKRDYIKVLFGDSDIEN